MADFGRVAGVSGSLGSGLGGRFYVATLGTMEGLRSTIRKAIGVLCRLNSNGRVRAILVDCRRNSSLYISARMNYGVNYEFYTSAVTNFGEGLFTDRVLSRLCRARQRANERISDVILVKVNRPLSGFSGIIGFLRVLSDRGNAGVDLHRISLSAYKLITEVCSLYRLSLNLALSVSLRTAGSTGEDRLVPIGGECRVSRLVATYHRCFSGANEHVSFRCTLVSNRGSAFRSTGTLGRLLRNVPTRIGVVPMGGVTRHSCHSSESDTRGFYGGLASVNIGTAAEDTLNSSVATTYNRLHDRCRV